MTTSILDYIFRWISSKYLENLENKDEPLPSGMPAPLQQRLTDIGYLGKSHTREMDGPACPKCGSIMVRSGTCHTCHSCGTSGGCG
jgi:ribonucleoside-diphosphate reductase alpha chain